MDFFTRGTLITDLVVWSQQQGDTMLSSLCWQQGSRNCNQVLKWIITNMRARSRLILKIGTVKCVLMTVFHHVVKEKITNAQKLIFIQLRIVRVVIRLRIQYFPHWTNMQVTVYLFLFFRQHTIKIVKIVWL
jgi:hypothetical protein